MRGLGLGFDHDTWMASPSGAELHLLVRMPPNAPRAVVQINHGLAEHAARYAWFADRLATAGIASYAHDHRGHGSTRAPDAPPRSFGGAQKVLDDVSAVHDRIAGDHPGIPVVIFGHSMGGLIAFNHLFRHADRVAGAAIWNANFAAGSAAIAARAILAWERFRMGSDVPSRILPRLTFQAWGKRIPQRRTLFDWLSHDPAQVDRYIADPLCGWDPSVAMWRDVFGWMAAGADDGNMMRIRRDLPLYLAGGADDPATEGGAAVSTMAARLRRHGFSNLVSTIYPQTRHESLNALNRNLIADDFLAWMDNILPGR